METKEYRTIDKSTWGDGPWTLEPDKRQWLDEETGYPCLIVRAGVTGALCGYVGIPETHRAYGLNYWGDSMKYMGKKVISKRKLKHSKLRKDMNNLDVHGGLTFSNFCGKSDDESKYICHVGDGEPWWIGFDAAHAWDISPAMDARLKSFGFDQDLSTLITKQCAYRDLSYVENEVRSLARQLKAME